MPSYTAILFSEDTAYVLQVFAAADRICYLPQFIGYRYSKSMVQSTDISGSALIAYTERLCDSLPVRRFPVRCV